MENEQKILYFQYTLKSLLSWYKEMKGRDDENDLSTIKVLKLLFFVSAAKSSNEGDNTLVDEVFTHYVAMPYGHVEYDVYSELKSSNGMLEFYCINNSKASRTQVSLVELDKKISTLERQLNADYRNKIDDSVDYLKKYHKKLILYPPFDLVELSHLWYSWRKNYYGTTSRKAEIPASDIKTEPKVFSF